VYFKEEVNTHASGIHLKFCAKLDFDFQTTAHRGLTSPPLILAWATCSGLVFEILTLLLSKSNPCLFMAVFHEWATIYGVGSSTGLGSHSFFLMIGPPTQKKLLRWIENQLI